MDSDYTDLMQNHTKNTKIYPNPEETEIYLYPGERHMSRIIYEHKPGGDVKVHKLSVISFAGNELEITPFRSETPSTIYHDTPLHLYCTPTIHLFQE